MSEEKQQHGGRKGPAGAKERVITREKLVPAKVVVGQPHGIDFRPATGLLKGSLTVIISDGSFTRTFVMHHPIGKTDLDGGDWVTSPVEEIPILVARADDPDAQRTAQMRAAYREHLASLQEPKILVEKEGIMCYPSGAARGDVVRAARKLAADSESAHRPPKGGEGSAGGTEAVKASYVEFIPEPIKAEEMKYLEFSKKDSTVSMVMGKYPDDYRTMGGVNADQPQVRASIEGRAPDRPQLFDGLVYQIANMKLLGLSDAKALQFTGYAPEPILKRTPSIPPRPKVAVVSSAPPASGKKKGKGRG